VKIVPKSSLSFYDFFQINRKNCVTRYLEPLKPYKMAEYAPAAAMFYITVVASNKVIQLSSVNTFIVVRSTLPVIVAIMEHFVFKKESSLNWMSGVALCVMTLGAFLYVQASGSIVIDGLDWIILYFITMPVDALLIKRALNRIELPPWSLALYNNLIAAMFMPLGAVLARQWEVFTPAAYTDLVASDVWFPVLVEEKCPPQKLSSTKHF
jgi:multisubunit Na+/H+ antiporter MnhG subunit